MYRIHCRHNISFAICVIIMYCISRDSTHSVVSIFSNLPMFISGNIFGFACEFYTNLKGVCVDFPHGTIPVYVTRAQCTDLVNFRIIFVRIMAIQRNDEWAYFWHQKSINLHEKKLCDSVFSVHSSCLQLKRRWKSVFWFQFCITSILLLWWNILKEFWRWCSCFFFVLS